MGVVVALLLLSVALGLQTINLPVVWEGVWNESSSILQRKSFCALKTQKFWVGFGCFLMDIIVCALPTHNCVVVVGNKDGYIHSPGQKATMKIGEYLPYARRTESKISRIYW